MAFTSSGACTNAGAIYTMTASSGTCSVIANQAGNTNYTAAPTVTDTVNATQASTATAVLSSLNPSGYGQAVSFTATVTGASPSGTVAFSIDGNPFDTETLVSGSAASVSISNLAVGTHTVTATYSGDTNNTGSTGTLAGGQVVSSANAGVSIASSLNPSVYGQSVTFTATISGANGLVKGRKPGKNGIRPQEVTGSVTWSDSNGPLTCTETGSSTTTVTSGNPGSATCTTSALAVAASDTITGAYSGDSNHNSGSGTVSQQIAASNGNVSVASGLNPSTYGQSVTFTATVTGDNGLAKRKGAKPFAVTGSVSWSANTGCSTSTVSGYPGTATCTTSILPVGASDTVTASYSGDANHNAGSGSVSQTVTAVSSSVSVGSSSNPSSYGQSVSFTAVVTGNSPTGTVAFSIDGNPFDTETLVSGSATSASISTLAVGTHTVTATYSGDTNNSGDTGTLGGGQVVSQATTTTGVTSTPNPSVYATSVTFTATINGANGLVKGRKPGKNGMNPMDPGGTVTWSANTGCAPSTVSGNPGVATCTTSSATHLPVGTDTVTATYSGDSNHSGSAGSVDQVVTGGIATTIDVTSVSPASEDFAANTPVTITAVLSWTGHGVAPTAANVTIGGNGNGTYGATSCAARVHETITCTATYTPNNADVPGSYTETAAFSGDTNYTASSSSETNNFTINSASSTTVVTSGLNPSTYGQSVTFTATITGENGFVKGRKPGKNGIKPMDPTGTVTWSANTGCSTSAVTGNPGVATCTTSSLAAGSNTVTATYSGDSNHGGGSGSVSQTVNPASQTITFTTTAPSSAAYNSTFGVAASASSGLTVAFTAAGSCTVADNGNGTATYTITSGAGTCTVKANQAGNSNYSAAAQVTESVSATPASQTINVTTPAPATAVKGFSFTVVANATSGLPITFTSSGICTNVHGTYTMTAATGTCTVKMNAPSSTNYTAAPQVVETTAGAPAVAPTVSLTGEPATANAGATFTVTAASNETGAVSIPVITTTTGTVCSVGANTTSGSSSSATVTMLTGTGTCILKATWAANYVYRAATVLEHTTAAKIAPTVTFTGAPSSAAHGTSFTVTATSNESGSVVSVPTITTTTPTECSVGAVTSNGSGGYEATVTVIRTTGMCTTKAAWALNADYAAASVLQHTTAH